MGLQVGYQTMNRFVYVVTVNGQDMEELVRSGEIQTIAPKDAKPLLSVETSPYKLLDVRPMWEREKAWVDGSLHVPLFIEDVDTSPVTLLKKWISMGFAGMWLGQRLTAPNEDFVEQIEEALPSKEQKIMVACGEGLRLVSHKLLVFQKGRL